jgi:hypothetical protein
MIKRLKKASRNLFAKTKGKLNLRFSKKIYLSYGENCLTDNILQRQLIKTFTTPFSHGRSNVEYILQAERDAYKDFLNPKYLQYELLEKKEVARLKTYNQLQNNYNELHTKGFEFTHHDVIGNENHRQKMHKRVQTLTKLKGKKKFVILYHHRANATTDAELLVQHLAELKNLYSTSKISSEVVCFTQNIINQTKERKLTYSKKNDIHYFVFNTLNEWAGDNNDIFWAKCDEDLITEMIGFVKKL